MDLTPYNHTTGLFLAGGLNTSTAKLALLADAYTPDLAQTTWDQLSAHEVSGAGYTAGGQAIGGTITTDNGYRRWTAPDTVFASLDTSFRYGVIYSGTDLLALIDFGSVQHYTGFDLMVRWAAPGIIEIQEL